MQILVKALELSGESEFLHLFIGYAVSFIEMNKQNFPAEIKASSDTCY